MASTAETFELSILRRQRTTLCDPLPRALRIVLPLTLRSASAAVIALVWSVRSGQLDDVDTPPRRNPFDHQHPPRRER